MRYWRDKSELRTEKLLQLLRCSRADASVTGFRRRTAGRKVLYKSSEEKSEEGEERKIEIDKKTGKRRERKREMGIG